MEKKTRKDSLTGNDIVDVEFLEKDLYPPSRLKQTDAGKASARLWNEIRSCWRINKFNKKKDRNTPVRLPSPRLQPCMSKMGYTHTVKNHVSFLLEYMPQKNKDYVIEKPVVFNGAYDEVPPEIIEEYVENAGVRGFKIILSPESQNMPMKVLARTFIQQLEQITSHKFTWFGAIHKDTDHIHCHLLINGVDRKTGENIIIPKEVVKNFRNYAGNICTEYLGPRPREMIELARSRLPESHRYTRIDNNMTSSSGFKLFKKPETIDGIKYEASIQTSSPLFQKRLSTLCSMGLARCFSHDVPPVYYLERGWENSLKSVGRYNTFLTARDNLKYVSRQNYYMYEPSAGEIDGVITNVISMNEEDIWNNAIVIEDRERNKAWYMPVRYLEDDDIINSQVHIAVEKNQHGKLSPTIIHLR